MKQFHVFIIWLFLLMSSGNNPWATFCQPEAQKLKVVTVALGEEHSLVLTSDGTVWAFGLNGNYQTAREIKDRLIDRPEKVKEIEKGVGIAAGSSSSFAWCADGKIWAWGTNVQNRLGGDLTANWPGSVSKPIRVQAENIRSMSHKAHSLLLMNNGKVLSWGTNFSGEVGTGDRKKVFLPKEIKGLENVKTVAAGSGFSLALTEDGRVWSWGNNSQFQLGDGTKVPFLTPSPIKAFKEITDISAGNEHAIACTKEGKVWSWGNNSFGQLGQGHTKQLKMPNEVRDLTDVVTVAAANNYNLVLKKDGTVWTWGDGSMNGHMGRSLVKNHHLPFAVGGLPKVAKIFAGSYHNFALTVNGELWVWGLNINGQLGLPTPGEYSAKPMKLEFK